MTTPTNNTTNPLTVENARERLLWAIAAADGSSTGKRRETTTQWPPFRPRRAAA